jgi:cytochrome c553
VKEAAIITTALALLGVYPAHAAGDAAAGQKKYAVCAGCHGPTGAGNEVLKYPKLAGLEGTYVREQLHAYRSGARDNATMKAMTAGLNDADIDNLSAYIVTLK